MSHHCQPSHVAAAAAVCGGFDDKGQTVESIAVLQAADVKLVSAHSLHTDRQAVRTMYDTTLV